MRAESFSISIASGNYINGAKIELKSHLKIVYMRERAAAWNEILDVLKKKCKIRSVGEGCAMYISEIISWHFTIAYVFNFAVYAHKCSHRLCTSIYVEVDLTHIVILFVDISSFLTQQ